MKGFRFLLFGLVICLASGLKAQFYDGPDDIYYYVEYENGEYGGSCRILNFDGSKACLLNEYIDNGNRYTYSVEEVKCLIRKKSDYFEEQVEIGDYKLKYTSNNTYFHTVTNIYSDRISVFQHTLKFSSDRKYLYETREEKGWNTYKWTFRKVDKSFFKTGRSRTPTSTLHE